MSVASTMRVIQLEGEMREQRNVMLQLRKYLAGALCTACGEPLGSDEELTQNDDEETLHSRCMGQQERDRGEDP